jgi:hypothetical protein
VSSRLGTRSVGAVAVCVLAAAMVLLPATATAAPGDTTTVAGGNGYGSAINQLAYPFGVAVDDAGNVFVADLRHYHNEVILAG